LDPLSLVGIAVILVAVALMYLKRFGVTQLLIAACLVVFVLEMLSQRGFTLSDLSYSQVSLDLSYRTIYLQQGTNLETIFTSMFVHANFLHIVGNILFMFLIGVQLEDRIGKRNYFVVYFVAGFAAVLAESAFLWGAPANTTLLLGASGAISGTMGTILILYPRDKIPMLVGPIFMPAVSVWIAVGAWFGLQLVEIYAYGMNSGTAFGAHLGGFLAGIVIAELLPKPKKRESVKELNLEQLEPLATTPQLKNALEHLKGEKEAAVRDAWLDYFAKHARCPRCSSALSFKGSKLKCDSCEYEVDLK